MSGNPKESRSGSKAESRASSPYASEETSNPRYKKGDSKKKKKLPPAPRPLSKTAENRAKMKDKVSSVYKRVQKAMTAEQNLQMRNRQSKRYRPQLPTMEELETQNPLFNSEGSDSSFSSVAKKTLPIYSMRNLSRKVGTSKTKSAVIKEAKLEAKGFADHATETKKDFDNYYFSPLVMTDDEIFEAAVNMLMLGACEDLFPNTTKFGLLEGITDFVRTVREGYTTTSYHNFRHATDVMQMMYLIVSNHLGVGSSFGLESYEPFALMVIALCHDLGHFGANNSFLRENSANMEKRDTRGSAGSRDSSGVRTGDYVDMYGDKSPLEKFHVAKASEIIQSHFLFSEDYMSPKRKESILDLLEYLVLWTDMDRHKEFMEEYWKTVGSNKNVRKLNPLTAQSTKDRKTPLGLLGMRGSKSRKKKNMPRIYLAMALKLSDISNVTRSFEDSKEWAKLLNIEFSAMGRIESENVMDLIQFQQKLGSEQDEVDMAQFTLNFMSAVSVPMAQSFAAVTKSGSWHMLNEMLQNMQIWLSIIDSSS